MRLAPQSQRRVDARVIVESNVQPDRASNPDGLRRRILTIVLSWILLLVRAATVNAAGFLETEQLFYSGHYDECLEIALAEFDRGVWNDRWPQLGIRCLMTTGRYEEARFLYERAKKRFVTSIGIRSLGENVLRYTDDASSARKENLDIIAMVNNAPWRYSSSADLVTLGRFFVDQGEDARKILELFFDRVKKKNSSYAPTYIASAELALSKYDFQLAAQTLEAAVRLQPTNPQVFYLQALAYRDGDREKAVAALDKALELNPRHTPSLLLLADLEIDSERYEQAGDTLTRVLEVNPWHPKAWAYHAVIAHLAGHFDGEETLRDIALTHWDSNHHVDYWIGQKLSQKYRFREGAAYQRQALSTNPKHLPAKFQLAQDLLRLGNEDTGWQLAQEVFDNDGYNVVAYNLIELHEEITQFTTLENERFHLRMDAREARIYGERVLRLLDEAYQTLCPKYDVSLDGPVTVEIFPKQKDFAIRTFGLPGGDGFLGVCFGRVITANSPASQGNSPSNWQSVLWHEFCHVVTLEKTQNRMPRWLSEGISVYEERQRDSAWGERMTPQYREMILGDALTPVGELSDAFLRPPSPLHLQFAYYEASLVVEFLIQEHGFETLKRVLADAAVGMPVNDSLQRYTGSLAEFEQAFSNFARERALSLAPELEFERPELKPGQAMTPDLLSEFDERDNNYWILHANADRMLRSEQFEEARATLETLHEQFPSDISSSSAAVKLARVYRELGMTDQERTTLTHISQIIDDALPVYQRLMELDSQSDAWEDVARYAEKMLAVQPLRPQPHRMLAKASRHLNRMDVVVGALQALLEMEPTDPAEAHYELASALNDTGDQTTAKRQVLMALEYAPRYQEALQLLLSLTEKDESDAVD